MASDRNISSTSSLDLPFCQNEITNFIAIQIIKPLWKTELKAINEPKIYRSPTSQFGQWALLKVYPDVIDAQLITTSRVKAVKWYKNDCRNPKQFSHRKKTAPASGAFTDRKLDSLMKKHKAGLVYIWSPAMTYSVQHAKTFKYVAQKLGLHFTSTMSTGPEKSPFSIKRSKEKFLSTKKMMSVELNMRGGRRHYPMTFFYQNGVIHEKPIVGVMTKEVLKTEIFDRMGSL